MSPANDMNIHQAHELFLKLEKAGLTMRLAQKIINSPGNKIAQEMIQVAREQGLEISISQKRAREIMGENFLGVQEAIRNHRIDPTPDQIATLSLIPFSEEELESKKQDYVLVADFGLSCGEMFTTHPRCFWSDPSEHPEFTQQFFFKTKGDVSWRLVRKNPISETFGKSFEKQVRHLGVDEELAEARVLVYTSLTYFLEKSIDIIQKSSYLRTASISYDQNKKIKGRVCISDIDVEGLQFIEVDDADSRFDLGICSEIVS